MALANAISLLIDVAGTVSLTAIPGVAFCARTVIQTRIALLEDLVKNVVTV